MGLRGAIPKPIAVLAAQGSRTDRCSANPPAFAVEAPTMPDWMTEGAKQEWRRITKILLAAGVLAKANLAVLTRYCVEFDRWVSAEKMLAKTGSLVQKAGTDGLSMEDFYPSPLLRVSAEAANSCLRAGATFGLDQSSASRIVAARVAEDDDGVATRPRIATGTDG